MVCSRCFCAPPACLTCSLTPRRAWLAGHFALVRSIPPWSGLSCLLPVLRVRTAREQHPRPFIHRPLVHQQSGLNEFTSSTVPLTMSVSLWSGPPFSLLSVVGRRSSGLVGREILLPRVVVVVGLCGRWVEVRSSWNSLPAYVRYCPQPRLTRVASMPLIRTLVPIRT